MVSTALLAHAEVLEVLLRPRTLPLLVDSEFVEDAREVTVVAVTVGTALLPPHFSGRRLGMRVRCGLPCLASPCDLRPATAHLLVRPRARPAAACASGQDGEQPPAVARFGQTCLFLGCHRCNIAVKLELMSGGLFGQVLGEAELCAPRGAQLDCELPLLGSRCVDACGREAMARAQVIVHVQTMSKGGVRQFLSLVDVEDRGSAFVVDSGALVATAKPVQGMVVPVSPRCEDEQFEGVAEATACNAAADRSREARMSSVEPPGLGCIRGPGRGFKDFLAVFLPCPRALP